MSGSFLEEWFLIKTLERRDFRGDAFFMRFYVAKIDPDHVRCGSQMRERVVQKESAAAKVGGFYTCIQGR